MGKTTILSTSDIEKKIRRMAYQIYEVNSNEKEIILAGIKDNGYILAKKIAGILEKISPVNVTVCAVQIDKKKPLDSVTTSINSAAYTDKSIVMIDDVLHTGTTLMYAVRHFLQVPVKQLKTLVLVDRNHKKLPIKVDFKGLSLSTSLQDHVEVILTSNKEEAYLE